MSTKEDQKRINDLKDLTKEDLEKKEMENLIEKELEDLEGGCWSCDSYCKICVSNK